MRNRGRIPEVVYHFTGASMLAPIAQRCRILASMYGSHGPGVYFTTLSPQRFTRAEISLRCWNYWRPEKMQAVVEVTDIGEELRQVTDHIWVGAPPSIVLAGEAGGQEVRLGLWVAELGQDPDDEAGRGSWYWEILTSCP